MSCLSLFVSILVLVLYSPVIFSFLCSALLQENAPIVSLVKEMWDEMLERDKKVLDEMRLICISSARPVESSITGTLSHHGEEIMKTLKSTGCYKTTDVCIGKASILSSETVQRGQAMEKEEDLVALYTPSLQDVIKAVNSRQNTDYMLVNSESYVWFKQGDAEKKKMKPDLFSTSRENILFRAPYSNAAACSSDRSFGIFPFWRCRGSIHAIWEAKTRIDDEGFGKACKYVQMLAQNHKESVNGVGPVRGVLFDYERIRYITGHANTSIIYHVTEDRLDAAGSFDRLVEFLCASDEWGAAVRQACARLSVELAEINVESSLLLGAGAFGRVYALSDGRVLKVSLQNSMEVETERMRKAFEKCPTIVVPVCADSYINTTEYSAYILEERGLPLPRTSESIENVGALLAQLHTAKVIHGDPRIANVIIVDKTYKWIDFRDSYDFTEIGRRNDLALFLESSFPTLKIDQLNQQLVDAYIFETSVDNMKQLIRSVPHVKDPA